MTDEKSVIDPVGMLAEEFLERYRKGERPSLTEYTDRHPEHAERIRQVFPLMVMMEQADDDNSQSHSSATAILPSDFPTLDRLGDYHIIREVGRGGDGDCL